jgi:hypothetical protein
MLNIIKEAQTYTRQTEAEQKIARQHRDGTNVMWQYYTQKKDRGTVVPYTYNEIQAYLDDKIVVDFMT